MTISVKVMSCIERSSWIRKMFEEGALLRKIHGDDKVFDFTLGNPSMEPPAAFHEELLRLAQNPEPGMHRYMNNAGYEETRAAVAEVLSAHSPLPVTADQVVMTCGAGGALNVVLKTILNPGEEVIILAPFFVEYKFYVDNHGGVTKEVWTDRETFQLDVAAIEAAIGPNTRAVIVNSPNNPTGVIYPRESLLALGEMIARKEKELERNIYVISDEPYARLAFDGQEVPGIFACVKNSVVVTSHSKDLALPGERIGYLAANPAMNNVGQFIEGAIFCNRVLGFVNAPALMQKLVAKLQRVSVDIGEYQEKRDILYNHLTALGFNMVKPGGGFYLFPRSPLEDDVAFVRLAQKHNILLVPGAGFGAPGYFRIAYCIDGDIIRRSLGAWDLVARDAGLL
ncbi:aspartate/methionine/tyrosine aminotransferase [Desulfuromonas soudanensis]|uniref:Aspartate/methionine/tyrosine aminotransferase n=1 Tax=Desulfuromonas soudanensis TaxID=1603606 RepID=A0A0M3QFF9_9BACT|nr:pyridoxal phosphate-dependent aminotransferase [Desulfuromonas soudanensis]ALC16159.1 aspartate/methionine/tyrosine aminotransferase [Desulfuromonas soudanensis]